MALVALASMPLWLWSDAQAQTAPTLVITSPSGAQLAETEFDVKVKLSAQPSRNVRVHLTWSQNYIKPASGRNIGFRQLTFSPGNWNTERTLKFVPMVGTGSYRNNNNFRTDLIFRSYELIPSEYEWCDQWFGEDEEIARANGRCWTATRTLKGPVRNQWATITVAPNAPPIWPHDVKLDSSLDSSSFKVPEGESRDYRVTLNTRRAAGDTYTITPRAVPLSGHTPADITITPTSRSWTTDSPNTVTFTVTAGADADIVDQPFKIIHDLSGPFIRQVTGQTQQGVTVAGPFASLSPAALQISATVGDDDKSFEPVFKDADGNEINATNPIQLPAGRVYQSGDDIYVTVELSNQASRIVRLKTQYNHRTTYTLLTNRPHDVDLKTDTPNLCSGLASEGVFYVNDGTPQDPILVPVCRMTHTYDEEPFTVSATNYAEPRSSYHSALLRFTEDNWNQPQRVYLRATASVAEGQTSTLRWQIERRTGTEPVEFVDPTTIGLTQTPPVITIDGHEATITEGGTASFTIKANPAPKSPITVNIGVSQGGNWGASGAATVSVSGATTTYTVTTSDDQVNEPDGTVSATVRSGTGYAVGSRSSAAIRVLDDDEPVPDSESESDGTSTTNGEQTADPQPPLEKYAALVKSFYDRITAKNQHGDSAAGGWNKRFLKAMGHPEYVDYPQPAVTVQRATELYNHGGPGANTAWAGTAEAIEYANSYVAPTPAPATEPTPTPTPTPAPTVEPEPTPQPPLEKYATLIARIKTDMQSPNYGNEAHDLKRVLKTLGVPDYANYDGGTVGVQEATNRRTQPNDNPHWEGIAEAIAYGQSYTP